MLFCCATSESTSSLSFNNTNSFCVPDSVIGLIRCESEMASLEQRVQAAEEPLASQVKSGISIAVCTDTEPCKSLQSLPNTNQITDPNGGKNKVSLEAWLDADHMDR